MDLAVGSRILLLSCRSSLPTFLLWHMPALSLSESGCDARGLVEVVELSRPQRYMLRGDGSGGAEHGSEINDDVGEPHRNRLVFICYVTPFL